MKPVILNSAEEAATTIATEIINAVNAFVPTPEKPHFVLGLPTGSTPLPVYRKLIAAYQSGEVSFKNVVTFNMDEYIGLPPEHEQSYHYFMHTNFFNFVDIPADQIHILNGLTNDTTAECAAYEAAIKQAGGIDIQLGGIGENGHLAFNEPGTPFESVTHLQQLTDDTIAVNSRFFTHLSDVPTAALTIGLSTIFNARRVLVLATGPKKAKAIHAAATGAVTPDCPASILQRHANAAIVCDTAAGTLL